MKKCPVCGQDNPSMYSHCEWCGRSIENVPDIKIDEEKVSKKSVKLKKNEKRQSSGTFKFALKMLSVFGIAVFIVGIMYLAIMLSFSIPYFIGACLCIVLAYLLNVFPKIFAGKKAKSIKIRTLLSAISLIAVVGAFVLAYFGIINS